MNNANLVETHKWEAGEIARLLSYLVLLLASIGLFLSANAIAESRFEKLGAGAFPKIVFVGLAIVSGIAIIDSVRKIPGTAYGRFMTQTAAWVRRRYLVFVCLGALTAYLLAIPLLGFSIASLIFLLGLQVILMPRTVKSIVIATIIALVFSYGLNWLFAEVFNVFLPRGVI
jgi:hypothetical protein